MQALPAHLHVIPALNVMTIVTVSGSVRNLAAIENYSFFTYLRMQMLQKTNEKGILTCPFSTKGLLGNSANSTQTLTGLCGFFASPFTARHVKPSGHNSSIHLNHIKLSLAQHECVWSLLSLVCPNLILQCY